MRDEQSLDILLIEDSPGDARLVLEALRAGPVGHRLRVMTDGAQALAWLWPPPGQGDNVRPDLILLDLHLPHHDGLAILRRLKGDERLRIVPVVMFSSSDQAHDVLASYSGHANSFVTKPPSLNAFIATVQSIVAYWSSVVTLPPSLGL